MTYEPACARCGFPREEHSYNGACYGLCGKFEEAQTMESVTEKFMEMAERAYRNRDELLTEEAEQRREIQRLNAHTNKLDTEIRQLQEALEMGGRLNQLLNAEIGQLKAENIELRKLNIGLVARYEVRRAVEEKE